MADDLVKRLREIQGQAGLFASAAADRIEALERERTDVWNAAIEAAVKVLRDWQNDLNVNRMPETAVTIGMAADVVADLKRGGASDA